jgi:adenine/guanine phosphoribosyltransferase-like PRPP-binding protein
MKTIAFYHDLKNDFHLHYPIGHNMTNAMEYINLIAPILQDLCKEHPINIWCMGSSGAILSALLTTKLSNQCSICHVKKDGENSHDSSLHVQQHAINIILDDFSRTGDTVNKIAEKAGRYIKYVDVLVLANSYKDWVFRFVPKVMINSHYSIPINAEEMTPTELEYANPYYVNVLELLDF